MLCVLIGGVPNRPRILVAVEPRLFGDGLTAMLAALDLDEVVSAVATGEFDAAIVSAGAAQAPAHLVIEVPGPNDGDQGWLHQAGTCIAVHLATAMALLALLDDRLAAALPRTERAATLAAAGGARE